MQSRGTFVIVYGRLFSIEYQSIDLTWRGAWPIRSRAVITIDGFILCLFISMHYFNIYFNSLDGNLKHNAYAYACALAN